MSGPVYLDYCATTPLRTQVREAMRPYLDEIFGNPSSIHSYGREARVALETCRDRLVEALGVSDGRLVFTGSGSEADNLAVLGWARRHPGGRVVRSSIEHKAVIRATDALAGGGYEVRVAPVDERGILDLDALAELLPAGGRPTLVSVMWANNETGVIQPVARVAELCRQSGAVLHSDAVQAFAKIPLDLEGTDVQLVAVSAHKLAGPKGCGALLVRGDIDLEPLIYGGGQEGGRRAGTENLAAAAGFAEAARLAVAEMADERARLAALRDRLQSGLLEEVPETVVNGADAPDRLPHVLSVSVPGVDIEGLLTSLDLEGVCVSSGSACTTGSVEPSHVMRAMGREGEMAANVVRLSLGWGSREGDVDRVLAVFPKIVRRLREFAN